MCYDFPATSMEPNAKLPNNAFVPVPVKGYKREHAATGMPPR